MQIVKYKYENINYEYSIDKEKLVQKINLADIYTDNFEYLTMLEEPNELLLPVQPKIATDYLLLESKLPSTYYWLSAIKHKSDSEKLQVLLNLVKTKIFLDAPVVPVLHPNNIILNYNLEPLYLYRGVTEKMAGTDFSEKHLVQMIQNIAGMFYSNRDYQSLAKGLLAELAKKNILIQELLTATTIQELEEILTQKLKEVIVRDEKNLKVIKRRNYLIWQQCAVWFGVLSILALVPLVFFMVDKLPKDKAFLEADTAFIKNDYDGSIKALDDIKLKDLPKTQRYELAYSYVEGKGFDQTQRDNIMKNLTLKSSDDYLDYWIQDGRGEFDKALDLAKQLEDSNLIQYALLEKMEAVRKDKKLKSEERTKQLEELEQAYQKYK